MADPPSDPPGHSELTVRGWMRRIVVIALVLAPITWLYRAVNSAREAARRSQCVGVLSQLSLALANYESAYGTLPPAVVPGPDGSPWHSWRVLVLPYMEGHALYASYRFDEPWDGPNNRRLIDQMPSIFECPTDQAKQGGSTRFTSVVALVGPGTCFPPDRAANTREFDGVRDQTVLLVELGESEIPWTAPVDLDLDTFRDQAARGEGSPHPNLRNVQYADFRVRKLSLPVEPDTLRRLCPPPTSTPQGLPAQGSVEG
ncbi:DUF1559 family PulG-like putative transporter [Tautonia rosea]|uniref:DUF1559 family PulG-like putative transporter n=1 Tax=Tautonia rosea TaxID=2728037 RepID=UPI00147295B4|nr:DUF1559 domain-containing protein [Tautonia rosea]